MRVSRASQRLETVIPGVEPDKVIFERNSANRQPGQDKETTGDEHNDNDDKEDSRHEVAASKPLSKVRYLHYFRLCSCVHQCPVKAVPTRSLVPRTNVGANAPASSQGPAQHVPTMSAQRRQAVPTSVGRQQGNPTCNNERTEDGEGEASRLPKVSTAFHLQPNACPLCLHRDTRQRQPVQVVSKEI